MTARYGPTDSAGLKATGSEKNKLRDAAGARRAIREVPLDKLLERAFAVAQRIGDVHVHLPGAVASVEFRYSIEHALDMCHQRGRPILSRQLAEIGL